MRCDATASANPPEVLAQTRRIVLKDGIVLSLDPKIGSHEKADMLIEGKKILEVGPNLNAPNAEKVQIPPRYGLLCWSGATRNRASVPHSRRYTGLARKSTSCRPLE